MKIKTYITILFITYALFVMGDIVNWSYKIDGAVNYKIIPELEDSKKCKNNVLAEYFIQKDEVIFRCGSRFYPFYEQYTINKKDFIQQLNKANGTSLQVGKK